MRCQLDPIKDAAKTIQKHLWEEILNAIVPKVSNGRIKIVKTCACGFRNHERFVNAIYFRLRGLDLSI